MVDPRRFTCRLQASSSLMTLPKTESDELMATACFLPAPSTPLRSMRSDPAKSTKMKCRRMPPAFELGGGARGLAGG